MKQLLILSGKGGTGKTSLTAAFAHLAHNQARVRTVLADADVDASNMELVLSPRVLETHPFTGGSVAAIDAEQCAGCGICADVCRFDAIFQAIVETGEPPRPQIYEIACEGCAACFYQCPSGAIRLEPQVAGHWFRSESRYGPLFHAALRPAQENSGKLVMQVKQRAQFFAIKHGYDLVLIDGPPGIGCPVISAATGVDLALIVTEPTRTGLHDLERICQTTAHFRVPTLVCINKADLYPEGVQQFRAYCQQNDLPIVGEVPFDEDVQQAMIQGEPVTAWCPNAPVSQAIMDAWQRVVEQLIN
jgi:MinD superfamily P-loop ATPase